MKRLLWLAALAAFSAPACAQFFNIKNQDGVWWFQRPDGSQMWSFGVDCVDMGAPGKPGNPSYNALAQFPSAEAWAQSTLADLTSWGFNSLGAWSDDDTLERYAQPGQMLPYFVVLHLGAYDKAPWNDMFDPECEKTLTDAARKIIPPIAKDLNLVGYFTDNEIGWWDDTIFEAYMAMAPSAPGKRKIVDLLRAHYGDMSAFKRDWQTPATSFAELLSQKKLFLKPGSNGIKAVHAWNKLLADYYYSLVRKIVREFDVQHMILGDRYQQYYNLETAEAIAPYVDVVSTNLGADYTDGSYSHFYLNTLHAITKKPIVITEYYFAARENRTGNRNHNEYFPTVQTQAERAAGFAACTNAFASLPFVIGAHWFQFYDEPPKGRGDGEDYDMGLVDVNGKPYEDMINAARIATPDAIHSSLPNPSQEKNLPQAPAEPMKGLLNWDRNGGFIEPATSENWADLYACHDGTSCYIGLLDMEYMDESLYATGHISSEDRPRLELHLGSWKGEVSFNGKGQKAVCSDPNVSVFESGGLKWTVILKIPLSATGPLDKASISGKLWSHARGYEMDWGKAQPFIAPI